MARRKAKLIDLREFFLKQSPTCSYTCPTFACPTNGRPRAADVRPLPSERKDRNGTRAPMPPVHEVRCPRSSLVAEKQTDPRGGVKNVRGGCPRDRAGVFPCVFRSFFVSDFCFLADLGSYKRWA